MGPPRSSPSSPFRSASEPYTHRCRRASGRSSPRRQEAQEQILKLLIAQSGITGADGD
jgi:hypothetical protein